MNMEVALEESKQGETPVEIEKEPARKASSVGRLELSADEQYTKAAQGKEAPLALEQKSDQKPPQEHLEQSLETTASSSGMEMAADTGEKGNSVLALKADEDTTKLKNAEGAPSEEVTIGSLKEHNSENEPGSQVVNGKQCSNDSYNREVREIGTQAAEAEGRDINAGKGKEMAGSRNGIQSNMDATRTSDSVDLEKRTLRRIPRTLKLIEELDFETDSMDTLTICISDTENADVIRNGRNPQEDRAPIHLGEQDMDCTTRTLPVTRQTKWWECCGMLDLLLRKDG